MNKFIPITPDTLIVNTNMEFDLYLRTFVNKSPRYILFCRVNEQFNGQKKEEILGRDLTLFISSTDATKYIKYQEKNLKNIISDESKDVAEKANVVYEVAKVITCDLMDNPRSGHHIQRAKTWVDNTINHILDDPNTFSSLFNVTSHNYHIYTHSINVTVIGLLFGKHLSLTQNDLNCLGTGMLLHDVGKIETPPEIINKPERLTKEVFKIVKKHPEAGLRILKYHDDIEEVSLKIVMQHHENYDGTGYPHGIRRNNIHLFGKISRIIDVYDALTTNRAYAIGKRPFAAIKEMKEKMINCFDEELIKEFICFLGPKDQRDKQRNDKVLHT